MFSNRLGITQIVVFTDKTIKDFFKTSFANGNKLDRQKVSEWTLNRCLVNRYPCWFLSVCKRVGRGKFSRRQLDEAL